MKPDFAVLGDAYRFEWPDLQISVELDRLGEERREGLTAEMTVMSYREPRPGLLTRQRFNVSSGVTRRSLENNLGDREPEVDWHNLLEQVCFMSLERWRTGEPLIDLRNVDASQRPRWLLPPYVEMGGPTDLFADGGAGKSLHSLAISLSVASGIRVVGDAEPTQAGPVLYLDWETDEYVHRERLVAIAAGAGLDLASCAPIYYRHEAASLPEVASGIKRQIVELGIVLVVVDSLGPARGAEPESADVTIKVFNAARSLRVPVLFVDHVTKERGKKSKPFGSVYAYNLSRLVWGMVKVQEEGSSRMKLGLECTKSNNGRLVPRRAYTLEFENSDEGVSTVTYARTQEFPDQAGEGANRKEQIASVIEANNGRAMRPDDIALVLEAEGVTMTPNNVRAVLSRHQGTVFMKLGEGWSLLYT